MVVSTGVAWLAQWRPRGPPNAGRHPMFTMIVFFVLAIVLIAVVIAQTSRTKKRGGSSIFPGSTAYDRENKRKKN